MAQHWIRVWNVSSDLFLTNHHRNIYDDGARKGFFYYSNIPKIIYTIIRNGFLGDILSKVNECRTER